MSGKKIGLIGGGRITRILLGGWAKSGKPPAEIVVSDIEPSVLAGLEEKYPNVRTVVADNIQAAQQDIVILAVHPPNIATTLPSVRASIKPDAILISLAPKLTIDKLASLLDGFGRIARMIPNAPSIVGKGFNPIAFGPSLTEQDRKDLTELFEALGKLPEVDESKLEIYAIVTAMGPTYLWPQLYELQTLAQSFGLTATEASEGLAAMVSGALAAMNDSGLSPDEVQDLVPVKPLADLQPAVLEAYRAKLNGVMERIRP